jgi:hypothetical protein
MMLARIDERRAPRGDGSLRLCVCRILSTRALASRALLARVRGMISVESVAFLFK